ncbi:hypothetical protein DPMN_071142 [Dreissena polymorpha]|uniref:Uncharacterized protein n=1 Tax=Dreissena polymorpha TaxID=45954 RepID=A0A9D3Z1R4_DREPO|nr:hypothetical protein DPMN_071142 [Dreissena polymorpha]
MDNSEFGSDLAKLSIDSDSVETYVQQFEDEIKVILDKHAPIKEKMQIYRSPNPWFSENILQSNRLLRRSETIWQKYRKQQDYENYKVSLHKYHCELKNEKQLALSQNVLKSKADSKKLYKFVSELTGSKSDNPLPTVQNENTLADTFADYFMQKIEIIQENLKDFDNYTPIAKQVTQLENLEKLTEDEIRKIINQIQTKST